MTKYLIKRDKQGFIVRWRQQDDFPSFINIDTQNAEYFWTRDDFKKTLAQSNVNSFVVTKFGLVVGYLIYELAKNTIYILNLSVHSDYQRCGIATKLMNKLKTELKGNRVSIRCDVREKNLIAHCFLKNNGFKAGEIAPNYFVDIYEDEQDIEAAYTFKFTKE